LILEKWHEYISNNILLIKFPVGEMKNKCAREVIKMTEEEIKMRQV
jgi:hypothetical protein